MKFLLAILAYLIVYVTVAWLSHRWSVLVGIGGLLVVMAVVEVFF